MNKSWVKTVITFNFRRLPLLAICIISGIILSALFANVIAPHDPTESNLAEALNPPFWQEGGKKAYPLGTDHFGRDILSRLIYGSRISLAVGLVSVVMAGFIGTTLALIAGYFGGWLDVLIMRLVDAVYSIPFFILAIAVVAIMGPSIQNIIIILAITNWTVYARVLRAEVLYIRTNDYVNLAIIDGASALRILSKHILPNVFNSLLVLGTLQIGIAIIAESALSFVGFGVPPPNSSWGLVLADGRAYMSQAWWITFFPGMCIFLTVMACNILGDWLRVHVSDPTLKQV